MACYNHPDKKAEFKCISCELLICGDCVKSFHAGGFFTYFCPGCNSQCNEVSSDASSSVQSNVPSPSPTKEKNEPSQSEAPYNAKTNGAGVDKTEMVDTIKETTDPDSSNNAIKSESRGYDDIPTKKIDLSSFDPNKLQDKAVRPKFKSEKEAEEKIYKNIQETKTDNSNNKISIISLFKSLFTKNLNIINTLEYFKNNKMISLEFFIISTVFLTIAILLNKINNSLIGSLIGTLSEQFLFSITFVLLIKFLFKTNNFKQLFIYIFGIYSLLLLIQNLSFALCSLTPLKNIIIGIAFLIFLIKLFIISRIIQNGYKSLKSTSILCVLICISISETFNILIN